MWNDKFREKMQKAIAVAIFFISVYTGFSASASAIILPDPTTMVDGLPIVQPYDDFLSYSAKLLIEWDNRFDVPWNGDDYDASVGTGKLDVTLLTPAMGKDNNPVTIGGMDFIFQDPLAAVTGSQNPTFSGTWGYFTPDDGKTQTAEGPVLVDTVLAYLQKAFGPEATIPVFTFDMNETGDSPDILLTAKVQIINPGCIDNSSADCDPANTANDTVVAEWALDNLTQAGNGIYDPDQPIITQGQICVDGDTQDFCVSNNSVGGSGKMDFLVVAPTMDLSLYDSMGYWFVGMLNMGTTELVCTQPEHGPEKCEYVAGALDNGGEELFLSGGFTPFVQPPPPTCEELGTCPTCEELGTCPPTVIPEPTTLLLFGSGLALAALRRRRFF